MAPCQSFLLADEPGLGKTATLTVTAARAGAGGRDRQRRAQDPEKEAPPHADWVVSGRPRMRLEMMLFCTSEEPPAMVLDLMRR